MSPSRSQDDTVALPEQVPGKQESAASRAKTEHQHGACDSHSRTLGNQDARIVENPKERERVKLTSHY